MELKTPPNDVSAEKALLGAMLVDKDIVLEAIEKIKPEYFYMPDNKAIYSAMLSLNLENEPVDIITVKNVLEKENIFDKIGGLDYLTELTNSTPIISNATNYINIIIEKYKLREIIQTGTQITELGYSNEDATQIVDLVEKKIFDLAKSEEKDSYKQIKDILAETFLELEKQAERGSAIVGVPSGFIDLDHRTTGFKGSSLIVLAARPGMGKSALAINIATNAALKNGIGSVIFNLEMSKVELTKRILSSEAMVDNKNINTGTMNADEMARLGMAGKLLSNAQIYIDDTPGINIMEIRAKARRLKLEKNIGLIVIDYLQLIEPVGRRNGTREQEISEISRALKKLAMELDIPIIALSQLSRSAEKGEKGKRPMLSDLRESGAIEQDADMVLFIYRDDYYDKETEKRNIAEIILAKNRGGSVGTVELLWMGNFTKFENLGDRDDEERF